MSDPRLEAVKAAAIAVQQSDPHGEDAEAARFLAMFDAAMAATVVYDSAGDKGTPQAEPEAHSEPKPEEPSQPEASAAPEPQPEPSHEPAAAEEPETHEPDAEDKE